VYYDPYGAYRTADERAAIQRGRDERAAGAFAEREGLSYGEALEILRDERADDDHDDGEE
jgi:hypothetical protein